MTTPNTANRNRTATHPADAAKLGKSKKHSRRKDWKKASVTFMTRATYIKCRTHSDVAQLLLDSDEAEIRNVSQYDYFWGSGRDMRGDNHFWQDVDGCSQETAGRTRQVRHLLKSLLIAAKKRHTHHHPFI